MRLTPWEEERILVFSAAELARRRRERGLLLNAPEAIAIICDAMFEAARDGADYAEIEAAGRTAVTPAEVIRGVSEIVDEVRLEVLMGDGVRLVVLVDPLSAREGGPAGREADGPGAVRPAPEPRPDPNAGPVPYQSTVDIQVSEGKPQVEVPDVEGKSSEEARQILEGAGLQVEASSWITGDRVVGQTPKAGETVEQGTTVKILLSFW